jgi:hypothetical protein
MNIAIVLIGSIREIRAYGAEWNVVVLGGK